MKDELPDLTPYLNKKGGNSQGRGEEPGGKTDISQKLSALVKKPGTASGTHPSVLSPTGAAQPPAMPAAEPARTAKESTPDLDDDSLESPIGIVKPQAPAEMPREPESPIGIVRPAAVSEQSPIGLVKAPPAADNGAGYSPENSTGTVRPVIAPGESNGSNGQDSESTRSGGFSSAIKKSAGPSTSRWGDINNFGETSHLDNTLVRNPKPSDKAIVINTAAGSEDDEAPGLVSRDDSLGSPSREMNRPGLNAPDKLKAPQAKPMSTLSSSTAPPLLKTPSKQPGRPAQPYSYKPAIEPGREGMAPKAPSAAPINKAPQPMPAPRPQVPSASQTGMAPQSPARPAASNPPQSPSSSPSTSISSPSPSPKPAASSPAPSVSSSSINKISTSTTSPSSSSSSSPPSSPSGEAAPAPKAYREETEAEKLARAFMEEARALQDSSRADLADDSEEIFTESYLPRDENNFEPQEQAAEEEAYAPSADSYTGQAEAPTAASMADTSPPPDFYASQALYPSADSGHQDPGPKASLSNLFDSGVLSSSAPVPGPKKALGFGNLLAGASTADEEDHHSTIADLMVPTGEHDALFAPDRREPSATSAFDELSAQINDEESRYGSLSPDHAFDAPSPSPQALGGENASNFADSLDQGAPPAFGSLFSNEIVTSGQDFSNRGDASFSQVADRSIPAEESESKDSVDNFDDSYSPNPKSLAISKLIEAVNQSESSEVSSATSGDAKDFSRPQESATSAGADLFSSEIVGSAAVESEKAAVDMPKAEQPAPAAVPSPADMSAAALEALAAFVPNADEEQHETKGLLAKLKAKDAAAKAAQKAAKAAESKSAAKEESKPDAMEESKSTGLAGALQAAAAPESAAKPMSSLASLLSQPPEAEPQTKEPEPVPAPRAPKVTAPVTEEADEDSGSSLGDAISDALDKLLGENADGTAVSSAPEVSSAPVPVEPVEEVAAPAQTTGGLSRLLDDDPDRFNRPINSHMREAEEKLEAAVTASAESGQTVEPSLPVEDSHPLTLTNSKVDALSRLLEVASKAPDKALDDKKKASESSNKLAEMVNKPPGKISRSNETLSAPDYMAQPNQQQDAFTSPFGGGTSPFGAPGNSYSGPSATKPSTSPFGTPVNSVNSGVSLNHTPAGGFSPTGQSQPMASNLGTASMSDMPKASGIASDAVSARIAALNRKLEEQTKGPGASVTVGALSSSSLPITQSNTIPPEMMPPPPPPLPVPDFVPNPIVDDSPQTRAELVNRILGSAKIAPPGAPDNPTRSMQELPVDQAIAQMQSQKAVKTQKAPPKSKARSRGGNPGFDPKTILLIVAVILIAGLGAVLAMQNGLLKGVDFSKITAGDSGKAKNGDSKASVEQLISTGELDKAREILESKKEAGKLSSAEGEKLYSVYYKLAEKTISNGDEPAEAVKLLEKIPSKTKKYKDAQKLLRKLKKKAKKN